MMTWHRIIRHLSVPCLLLFTCVLAAAEDNVAEIGKYDLTLFGYRLGMSYEKAVELRSFHRIENTSSSNQSVNQSIGIIDNIHLAGVDMTILVYFQEGRVHKILGRFNPAELEQMLALFRTAFGPGKDLSKVIERSDGYQMHHDSYRWEFPGARIYLIRTSGNDRFATASMLNREKLDAGTEPEPASNQ